MSQNLHKQPQKRPKCRFLFHKVAQKCAETIHQSYFLVALSAGVVAGTILGLVFKINFFASPLWLALTALLFLYAYFRPHRIFVVTAFLAGAILSFFRIATELQGTNYIQGLQGQTVVVTGDLHQDPNNDEDNNATKFALVNLRFGPDAASSDATDAAGIASATDTSDIIGASNAAGPISTPGTLYITLHRTDEIQRGDTVTLEGKLTDGFGTYAGFLYQPKILKISRPDPGDWVLAIRNWFAARIQSQVEEPESSLGLSYLLGMKTGLPSDLNENLRLVGLVHIVVASGAHLSILVNVAKKLFGKLSRFAALLGSILFIVFFMSLVGWTPSILRAGIMSILTLVAWYVGRKFAPWRIILLVAAATLLKDPTYIINLGWLLSFASFAGIMLLGPKITKFFYGPRKPKFIASTILTTLSATLLTLPITLYYYGTVSLISVAANLLILPTLSPAMGLTFLTGLTADIPVLNTVIGFVTTKLLDFHIAVVGFFAQAKSFLIEIDPYQPQVFTIYIIIIIPFLIGLFRRKMLKLKKYHKIGENHMSGHSKWATTKRQKAVVDAKRGALFTKIGNQIAIAARAGTDPNMNPSLAMVLEKARLANMPKANIERAIARVADKSAAALIEETYEAYGPGGVGIVIEVATDNKNRTMPEVRHTLDKNGGRMADPGSVMFQFARKGVIEISEKSEDALMQALDAGAEDATEEEEGIMIYTAPSDLMKVRNALVENGLTVTTAELQYVPTTFVPIEGDHAEKLEKLLSAIDDLDDVTNVYTNAE